MMSNEEFDRRMEFFLNQQAQFDADMQEIQEIQRKTDERLDRTGEKLEQTADTLAELTTLTSEGFKKIARRFDAIARSFKVIAANGRETDARIRALVHSQTDTEEKIRKTNAKFDRHLKEDHGGSPKT